MSALKRKAELTAAANDPKKPKKDATLTSFFGAPKPSAMSNASSKSGGVSSNAPPEAAGVAPKFDKEKWTASLSAEQKELLKLEIDTLHPSWLAHLKDEIASKEFLELKRFIQREIDSGKKIFPPAEDIYSWSRHTPLNTVKVVILGQDPYHNHNQAHGLCFSVRPPTPAPPSLKNMFIALKKDYPSFTPPAKNGGLLTPWAEQGVLMLNTYLTVRAHEANSHSNKGWERFTQKVIDTVVKLRTRGVVFLAWGTPAQKRCAKITGTKHVVMKSVHPSPLSAMRGFLDCGHFKAANEWLQERYGEDGTVNWDLNVVKPIKAPETDGPVRVTAGVSAAAVEEDGPVTELPTKNNGAADVKGNTIAKQKRKEEDKENEDEFDVDDDEDAIEALEELAQGGVTGDVKK